MWPAQATSDVPQTLDGLGIDGPMDRPRLMPAHWYISQRPKDLVGTISVTEVIANDSLAFKNGLHKS